MKFYFQSGHSLLGDQAFQNYSLMNTRVLLLVGLCLLLDYSFQFPSEIQLQSRTTGGVKAMKRWMRNNHLRTHSRDVSVLEGGMSFQRHWRSRIPRIKRGWVWNQFFVLEEHMGTEPQYVGKIHTDLDHGENVVKYTLSGEGAGSIFTIDQITGDIHALVSLDREEKSYYMLHAQAVDMDTGCPLEPATDFIINVQDINDNEPQFSDGPYSASVPEMSPAGTYVTQVTATDADDPTYGNSARIIYSIVHGLPYFSVDPKTGVIRTALANMDCEVKKEYHVLLQAKDMGGHLGGLASTTTINITLTDVNNNPPHFSKSIFYFQVSEFTSVGTELGQIEANDLDIGKNAEMDYLIVPDEDNMFDIISNGREGILVLRKTLDYESKRSYTFKVEVCNVHVDHRFLHLGPFKDSATVKVNILDMDESPVFTQSHYTMDVYEDTPPGSIIGSVTAHDLDTSSSAVRYSLEWHRDSDHVSYIDIDTIDGTLFTTDYLDREAAVQHDITVLATKVNNPTLSAKVSVSVNILDVNEFAPELVVPSDIFVCENSRVGQVIQMVSAVDKDLPPLGQRIFFNYPKDFRNRNFTIRDFGNNTAGIVTRTTGFQRQLQDAFILPVVVEDSGYPAQSSTTTLTVRVCSCESRSSLLTCSTEGLLMHVGLSSGTLMGILLCASISMAVAALYIGHRCQKDKENLISSKEDIQDNVIHYNDEGGGEADTHSFDMRTLRNTHSLLTNSHGSTDKKGEHSYGDGVLLHLSSHCENVRSPDIHCQTASIIAAITTEPSLTPPCRGHAGNAEVIMEMMEQSLEETHMDYTSPINDSLLSYAYKADGSHANSLSSMEKSWVMDELGDFSSLVEWGQPFKIWTSVSDKSPFQNDMN